MDDNYGKNRMKWILFIGASLLIGWIHLENRKNRTLSWADYGKKLLGIEADTEGRKKYLDRLRFLAAMLVIAVHSMQSAASKLSETSGLWYFLTGAAGLGLCCNLLFVMISGALLLPCREEAPGTFYRKRLSKVVLPLAVYYLFYLHRSGLVSLSPASWLDAVFKIWSGPVELVPHFWLVYVLVRLYIPVPFLRRMTGNLSESVEKGIAWAVIIGAALKTGCYFGGIGFGFDTVWFSWEGIFLLGYLLSRDSGRKYDKRILTAGAVSAVLIVWINCTRSDGKVAAANDSLLMILFSMAVFLVFLRCEKPQAVKGKKQKGGVQKLAAAIVQMISRYSYSILLIHWFMLFVVAENHLHLEPFLFGPAYAVAGVLLQSAAALIFSLIFAVLYDNTAVLLAEWLWEKLWNVLKGKGKLPGSHET
jgi:surface polysaccharide O-acyltransferase-like enzyme